MAVAYRTVDTSESFERVCEREVSFTHKPLNFEASKKT